MCAFVIFVFFFRRAKYMYMYCIPLRMRVFIPIFHVLVNEFMLFEFIVVTEGQVGVHEIFLVNVERF